MIEITVGTVFNTPFETGCVATAEPNQFGWFNGLDSEGVEVQFALVMVSEVTSS